MISANGNVCNTQNLQIEEEELEYKNEYKSEIYEQITLKKSNNRKSSNVDLVVYENFH